MQPLAKQLAEAEEEVVKEMLECQVCKATISGCIEIVIRKTFFSIRESLSMWEDTSDPWATKSPRR